MKFPGKLTADAEGGFMVTFRDIPEAISQGDDEKEALELAKEALLSAFMKYVEEQRQITMPSPQNHDEILFPLPSSVVAKVLLFNEMTRQQIKPDELANRLNLAPLVITQLINMRTPAKLDAIQSALLALDRDLILNTSPLSR